MRQVSALLRRHLSMILSVLVLLVIVVVLWIFSAYIARWLYLAQLFDAVAFLREHRLAAAILGGCLLVLLALIWLSKWQDARPAAGGGPPQDVEVAVDAAKSELKADILMLESKVVKKIQSHERRISNVEEQEGIENPEKN
jgi:type VI protein secretion system component VasK